MCLFDCTCSYILSERVLQLTFVLDSIFCIGGYNDLDKYLQSTERYDPVTDAWKEIAAINFKRSDLAAVVLNGHVYAIGKATAVMIIEQTLTNEFKLNVLILFHAIDRRYTCVTKAATVANV